MQTDPSVWVRALRESHDGLAALVKNFDLTQLQGQSYCTDWTIADVLSHLGSSAEIFSLILDAGLEGREAPTHEMFAPIWGTWNAASPAVQAKRSVMANEELMRAIEELDRDQMESFHVAMFGMDLDAVKLFRMRLFEHAVHTWDIASMFDKSATLMQGAVELLIDGLSDPAARSGKPFGASKVLKIETSDPGRTFTLVADGVRVEVLADQPIDGTVTMTSEQFIRLVYGRLDPVTTTGVAIEATGVSIADLCTIFTGF